MCCHLASTPSRVPTAAHRETFMKAAKYSGNIKAYLCVWILLKASVQNGIGHLQAKLIISGLL